MQLKVSDPAMMRAVDNILDDLCCPANPYGIPEALQSCLDEALRTGGELRVAVRDHRSLKRPDLHVEVKPCPSPILRAMSMTTFQRWHLGDGTFTAGAAWSARERSLRTRLRGAGPAVEHLNRDRLRGTTGRLDNPTWWTWDEHGTSRPADGQAYMLELGLPEYERLQAENDGVIVEIAVDTTDFRERLFRSTGLDDFSVGVLFRPNCHRREPFGRTVPLHPAAPDVMRPEAVSRSVLYLDGLRIGATVHLTWMEY